MLCRRTDDSSGFFGCKAALLKRERGCSCKNFHGESSISARSASTVVSKFAGTWSSRYTLTTLQHLFFLRFSYLLSGVHLCLFDMHLSGEKYWAETKFLTV